MIREKLKMCRYDTWNVCKSGVLFIRHQWDHVDHRKTDFMLRLQDDLLSVFWLFSVHHIWSHDRETANVSYLPPLHITWWTQHWELKYSCAVPNVECREETDSNRRCVGLMKKGKIKGCRKALCAAAFMISELKLAGDINPTLPCAEEQTTLRVKVRSHFLLWSLGVNFDQLTLQSSSLFNFNGWSWETNCCLVSENGGVINLVSCILNDNHQTPAAPSVLDISLSHMSHVWHHILFCCGTFVLHANFSVWIFTSTEASWQTEEYASSFSADLFRPADSHSRPIETLLRVIILAITLLLCSTTTPGAVPQNNIVQHHKVQLGTSVDPFLSPHFSSSLR